MDTIPKTAQPGDAIRAADWNALAAVARGARLLPGINTPGRQGAEGFVFDLPVAEIAARSYQVSPFPIGPLWTFGIGIDANVVTIYNPRAKRFGDNPVTGSQIYTCANAAITLADGEQQRIVWEWSESSGLSIQTNAQVNDPTDTSLALRGIVCVCDCVNGWAYLSRTYPGATDQLGHILVLPVFSKAST